MTKTIIKYFETDVGYTHFLVDGDYSYLNGTIIDVTPVTRYEKDALHLLHGPLGEYKQEQIKSENLVDTVRNLCEDGVKVESAWIIYKDE